MRLSKERKVYVAIFGLGLAALVADRLWFSPSEAAAAAPSGEPQAEAASAKAAPEQPEVAAAPSFRDRLAAHAVWQEGPLLDAFVAPANWGAGADALPTPASQASVGRDEFVQAHRLSAVFGVSGKKAAIIDGRICNPGQVLDGYTLVEIEDTKEMHAAIFERNGVRARLVVSDRSGTHKPDKGGQ